MNLPTQSAYADTKIKFDPIGRTLQSIEVSKDTYTTTLVFDDAKVELGCDGDCCAHAFFSDLEVASDLPAKVLEWNDDATQNTGSYDDCEVRDTQFIKLKTDKGYIDFSLHTDHNGYYGGWYFVSSVK